MDTSMFDDDIVYVGKSAFVEGPGTPGQPRETAFETAGLWAGVTSVIADGTPSSWHHHADYDSIMYMLEGEIRVDWGVEGEKSFVMGPGDFAFFRRGVIHRAEVLKSDRDARFVAIRIGEGETVVNVDGPGANAV